MKKVLITPSSYKNCRPAVEQALDAFPVAVRGRKVLIKVNGMAGMEPEEGAITHPQILSALVAVLEQRGAAEIMVGDNPGITYYGRNQVAFAESGLLDAAGGHYVNIGKQARPVAFHPDFIEKVFPSTAVLDADVVISVPKFKTHARVGLSVGLKNNFGILPGAQKSNLHHRTATPVNFARMLVEVFRVRPPDLFIVDAVLAAQGIGPYSQDLRYLGLIIAADNAVALDATCARMMGLEPDQVPLLRFAQQAGLGSYAREETEVQGPFSPIPGFTTPPSDLFTSTEPIKYSGGMAETPAYRPRVEASRCDGCRICADDCPAGALTMSNGQPRVGPSLCVPCFCCQEACPQQAISLALPR